MNTYNRIAIPSICALVFQGAFACATPGPSPGLLQARAAYEKAEAGPATKLTPADLHEAKVQLDTAEKAYSSDPGSALAAHKAYLALRRAELADVQGRTAAANADLAAAQKQAQAILDQQLATTRQKLADVSAADQQTQTRLAQTQAAIEAERQAQAQAAEKARAEISQAQAKLEAEQQARAAAEARAKDAREALEKAGAVKEEPRGTVITLSGSVLFASSRSVLLPAAQRSLDQVAEALRATNGKIIVEGHTDSRGSDETNLLLSQRRAEAVSEYLASRGVQRERLQSAGLGSGRPVAGNSSAEGRANNRRVEIIVTNQMTASPQH